MKTTILALFVAAAAAAPQNSEASQTTTALTPIQSCLSSCTPSDVNCQAICVGVPHPGEAQMGLVTDCVAACDQGDGSTAASEAYGRCRNACLASYIITSGTAAPGGAYTTPAIPGVSQTAAAVSASASAGASDVEAAGMHDMATATFLIPVDHEIACLYATPYSTATVEVHPFPKHVLHRLDCGTDGRITLSYGEDFSYLPTPYARETPCPACPSTVAPPREKPTSFPSPWPGKASDVPPRIPDGSSKDSVPSSPGKPTYVPPPAKPSFPGKPSEISQPNKPSGAIVPAPASPGAPGPVKASSPLPIGSALTVPAHGAPWSNSSGSLIPAPAGSQPVAATTPYVGSAPSPIWWHVPIAEGVNTIQSGTSKLGDSKARPASSGASRASSAAASGSAAATSANVAGSARVGTVGGLSGLILGALALL